MTVHETWGSGRHGWSHRVRAVASWLEQAIVGPAPGDADDADLAWNVEPFPGPPAGAGHVRLLPAARSVDLRASSDRPVVAGPRHR